MHAFNHVTSITTSCCIPWRGLALSCGALPGTRHRSAALLGCHKHCSPPDLYVNVEATFIQQVFYPVRGNG